MMVICPIVHPLTQQITENLPGAGFLGAFEKKFFKEDFHAESFADLHFPKTKSLFYVTLSS